MTGIDLRIAFKMDTGMNALWSHNHDGRALSPQETTSIKGHPRSVYGEWLEEKSGKWKYLRDRYYKLTNEIPTSNYFGDHRRKKPVIFGDYIEWLEEFIIKFKPEIIKKLINA